MKHISYSFVAFSITLPSAVIEGVGAKGIAQVIVTNEGNVSVAKGQRIDVDLVLRPNAGGADVWLTTISGASLSSLKPGASKPVTMPVKIPASVPTGDYRLVAVAGAVCWRRIHL